MRCNMCGKALHYDWLFCPCQFGGYQNSDLEEQISGMEELISYTEKEYEKKPSLLMAAILEANLRVLREMQEGNI